MRTDQPANLAASIRQQLLNLSLSRNEDPNLTLVRFALERLLYRLGKSKFAAQFILKGASLLAVWAVSPRRPTSDLELLGFGGASKERLFQIFQRLCHLKIHPDGLTFYASSIRVTEIREAQSYAGQRVKLIGLLGSARIPVQVDVGFGDAVTPEAKEIDYPTLLKLPAPRIRAYPPETVIAEKLQAMVVLGMQNSRMRDFYDLRVIGRQFSFDGATLVKAVRATFSRRNTDMPVTLPIALSEEFRTDVYKINQWNAFLKRSQLEMANIELSELIDELRTFLVPVLNAAIDEKTFSGVWPNGGPWEAGVPAT